MSRRVSIDPQKIAGGQTEKVVAQIGHLQPSRAQPMLERLGKSGLGESLNRRRGSVEIVVDDDGPGVPKDSREDVFKPFFRLDASRNEETGGTGLGLTIARDILRSHGGDLTLGDSPLGGLRAVLRVPV